jgi:type 1 glutamine amidotransferase
MTMVKNLLLTLTVVALAGMIASPSVILAQARSGARNATVATGPSAAPAPARRERPEPPAGWKSVRPVGAELTKIGVAAANKDFWFDWTFGAPGNAFPDLTFADAVEKTDALVLTSIEGFDTETVSFEIPKKLNSDLLPGEREAINNLLRDYNMHMQVYHVSAIPADNASRRKLFQFAKDLNVDTIACSLPDSASLAAMDQLAQEFSIHVAVEGDNPKLVMDALQGRSKSLGISADLGRWMEQGIKPVDGLAQVKDRLMLVTLRDHSALGPGGSAVPIGNGAGDLSGFFLQAFQSGVKPLYLMVGATGTADPFANLQDSVAGLDDAMLPAMSARVRQISDSPQGAIHSPDGLSAEMKAQIDAAVPRQPIVKPKKPRKLLVMDLSAYTHATMQHMNLMLQLMAKYTGAFEPVFSNDLNNLKYPQIKQYDAVFLNSVVGLVFNDPEIRAGILRFVREGGGFGGNHGVTYAALNWPEFAKMMGGWSGEHHVETQMIKVDDPNSPLTAMFHGKDVEMRDEFYHFPMSSPYSRERLHVLLSIDVQKSDTATSGRMCAKCTRSDGDYGLAWIRSYGKGRIYVTPLGHTPDLYTQPVWGEHLLAAIQFMLGDLDADTTPSAKLAAAK